MPEPSVSIATTEYDTLTTLTTLTNFHPDGGAHKDAVIDSTKELLVSALDP